MKRVGGRKRWGFGKLGGALIKLYFSFPGDVIPNFFLLYSIGSTAAAAAAHHRRRRWCLATLHCDGLGLTNKCLEWSPGLEVSNKIFNLCRSNLFFWPKRWGQKILIFPQTPHRFKKNIFSLTRELRYHTRLYYLTTF